MTASLRNLLAIVQQSEYHYDEFKAWVDAHPQYQQEHITPPTQTMKLRLVASIAQFFFFLPELQRIRYALICVMPIDLVMRGIILGTAFVKLRNAQAQGLKIIAIAGSHGKTSTKHIMLHVLSGHTSTLATPESVNTALGISEVILHKLKRDHKVFIIELGEFYPGHIKHLAWFVRPNYGILTPVGRQHLQRFGSLEEIIKTMHGLVEFFGTNTEKMCVAEQYRGRFSEPDLSFYGTHHHNHLIAEHASVSRSGTEYDVRIGKEVTHVYTPLFGEHQAVNTLPSFWIAKQLNLSIDQVVKRLATVQAIPHRHQPTFGQQNILILDNGYNTNPDSIQQSLQLLNDLRPSLRVFITMGFVELGEESVALHRQLGKQLAERTDLVGLIQSPATSSIVEGYLEAGGKKEHVVVGGSQEAVMAKLSPLLKPNSVIVFEGGYRELYT